MQDFSRIARSLTKFIQKGEKYVWTAEYASAFGNLKNRLMMTAILKMRDRTGGMVIYSDTSERGLRCMLMQHGHVIAYAFRQLKPYEKNYPTNDMKFAAVIFTLEIWRHYLLGDQVLIYTNHKSLKYIFTQKELNMRQMRWLIMILIYSIILKRSM